MLIRAPYIKLGILDDPDINIVVNGQMELGNATHDFNNDLSEAWLDCFECPHDVFVVDARGLKRYHSVIVPHGDLAHAWDFCFLTNGESPVKQYIDANIVG